MNALIENTLNIISKICDCKKGYLLQITDQGYNVLSVWGARAETFSSLNNLLFKMCKSKGVDTDQVTEIPAVTKELKSLAVSSLYIKEILLLSERNVCIYILLFPEDENIFIDEGKDKFLSVLSILSRQIKNWIDEPIEITKFSPTDKAVIQAERTSSEWEDRFKLILKTSPNIIFILDKSGKISLVNEVGKEFFEYSSDELKEKYFFELVDKADLPMMTSALNLTLLENKTTRIEIKLCSKSGRTGLFELNMNKITKNSKVIGLLGIGKDLAEKMRYEAELKRLKPKLIELNRLLALERSRVEPQKSVIEELNRLKYEFISGLSHEFRSTLASIIGFSETIESDPELPDSMKKEFNRIIIREGKRLAKLINYLLESTGVEDRFVIINKSNIGIVELVQNAINSNSQFASVKKIEIGFDHPEKEIYIEADEDNLNRAINALINNAIRFTGESGRVKIIVNNLLNEVEITISDTGIGIPETDQPYLFQRFYSVSRRLSDIPSLGVGLVFVKQIIDSHKGLITVQSDVGSGTTFTVKLPKRSKIEKNEVKIE
jgi:PAS domain S-box-containing protein